jgi:transposase
MQDVCTVLDVTRETIRKWKEKLRQGGITNLISEKKAGKRSKLDTENKGNSKLLLNKTRQIWLS